MNKISYACIAGMLLLVISAFALFSYRYVQRFNTTLLEENEAYLSEVADHIAVYTKTVLSDTQNSLQNSASVITTLSAQQRLTYLQEIVERENFSYAGYAFTDGIFYSTESFMNTNVLHESSFQNALAGKTTISNIARTILEDRVVTGIIISVPIYDENTVAIGALSAMLELSKIDSALKVESFQGKGYSYIIDATGNLILQNKSVSYSNFFRILENVELDDDMEPHDVQQRIQNQEAGMLRYHQLQEERYAYFTPLGINDWTIISIVAKEVITGKTDVLLQQLIVMNTAGILVFILLFCTAGGFWILSQNRKNAADAKTAFLANMSHEIRTPMNAIVGTSEILMQSNLNKEQEYYVNNILQSSHSLLTIVNEILDYAKMAAGKYKIYPRPYEIASLLFDITTLASIRIGSKNVKLQVMIDAMLPHTFIGDMTRIKQILVNIVGNAMKFTNEGYIQIAFSLVKKEGADYLEIKVIDTGCGIKKQDIPNLFESFYQIDIEQSQENEGTGLGLPISMSLCKLMNGDLKVDSEYGKGSCFTITLKQEVANPTPLLQDYSYSSYRFLILEEEEIMREFYASCMKELGISLYTCISTKEEGMACLQDNTYDFVMAKSSILEDVIFRSEMKSAKGIHLLPQQKPAKLTYESDDISIYTPMFAMQLSQALEQHNDKIPITEKKIHKGYPHAHVLVVDDNELNREIAMDILSFYAIQVDGASSGKEAIEMIQKTSYDLVFMDHMMPDMDGIQALKKIRALSKEEYQTLPVIALTANAISTSQDMFFEAGFTEFLSKPINIHKLQEILDKWLSVA